jgi:hypothetical protein
LSFMSVESTQTGLFLAVMKLWISIANENWHSMCK